jgi:hypothetical protein
MNLLEKCIVTEDFCNRQDTYNIIEGGSGGWNYVNKNLQTNERRKNASNAWLNMTPVEQERSKNSLKKYLLEIKNNPNKYKEHIKKISDGVKLFNQTHPEHNAGKNNHMYGHVHGEETRKKLSLGHLGEKNPNYGTMWICNDLTKENRMIKKTDIIPEGWRKGRICLK